MLDSWKEKPTKLSAAISWKSWWLSPTSYSCKQISFSASRKRSGTSFRSCQLQTKPSDEPKDLTILLVTLSVYGLSDELWALSELEFGEDGLSFRTSMLTGTLWLVPELLRYTHKMAPWTVCCMVLVENLNMSTGPRGWCRLGSETKLYSV